MAYRDYGVANRFCVNPNGQGNYLSITQCLADLVTRGITTAVIYLFPGIYSENFSMPAGNFTLSSLPGGENGFSTYVTINGKITLSSAGVYGFSHINMYTNGDYGMSVTSTNCFIWMTNCFMNATNFSFINMTQGSNVQFYQRNCVSNVGALGITFGFMQGICWFQACQFNNSASSSVRSVITNGYLFVTNCYAQIGFASGSGGTVYANNSWIGPHATVISGEVDLEAYVHNSTDTSAFIYNCVLASGAASAVTINSGAVTLANNTIISTNVAAIGGTGTAILGFNDFLSSTGITPSVVTLAGRAVTSGMNILNGGTLEMLTASTLQIDSGATVQVQNGAVLNINAGASIDVPLSGLLVGKGVNTPVVALALTTNGQIPIGGAGGPVAATLTAGSGISITNGANSITIASLDAGFTWNNTTGTSATLVAENGYQANNAGVVTYTLPTIASSTFGDTIEIMGLGAGGWAIAQLASQQIIVGNASSTVGATGSVASTNRYDCIQLVYTTTSGLWRANDFSGNLTVT